MYCRAFKTINWFKNKTFGTSGICKTLLNDAKSIYAYPSAGRQKQSAFNDLRRATGAGMTIGLELIAMVDEIILTLAR